MRNLAARAAMMAGSGGAAGITTSMYNNGALGGYSYHDFSGSGGLNITFSFWTNCSADIGRDSNMTFQYGNSSNGMAFSPYTTQGEVEVGEINVAVLCEAKYWVPYKLVTSSHLGTWHHYVITANDTSSPFELWIDGVKHTRRSSSGSGAIIAPTGRFYMLGGFYSNNYMRRYEGYATRFTMWNRILTDAEVAADYALGQTAPTLTSDIIHYWDGTLSNGKFKDLAGDWDLTIGSGCSQSNVTPWSNT